MTGLCAYLTLACFRVPSKTLRRSLRFFSLTVRLSFPCNTSLSTCPENCELSTEVLLDCGWSLLNHGVAERRRCDLGNLNPD